MVESSTTVVKNEELIETCSRYEVALVEALQVKVGFTATPVAPSEGERSAGGEGGATIVAKLRVAEKRLEPPSFFALTRQKYGVLGERGPTCRDVVVIDESSKTVVVKLEFVET